MSTREQNERMLFTLTPRDRNRLAVETSGWGKFDGATGRILRPREERE